MPTKGDDGARIPRRTVSHDAAAIEAMRTQAVDLVPLTESAGLAGLYADGNQMPASHRSAAPPLVPIDGALGFAVIGMSNGLEEWAAFRSNVQQRGALAVDAVLASGAVRFRTMRSWNDPLNRTWDRAIDRMAESGIEPAQVQVLWMKMGSQLHELGLGPTQERVAKEHAWLRRILVEAVAHLPNLRRVYMSSRIYAGYAQSSNHCEPATGYDNGLAVKSVVADSVAGRTPVWVAWGPYLWGNGSTPRKDGFVWLREDFDEDGLHPSPEGARKVAGLLYDFFSNEPGMAWMFSGDQPPSTAPSRADAFRSSESPRGGTGN